LPSSPSVEASCLTCLPPKPRACGPWWPSSGRLTADFIPSSSSHTYYEFIRPLPSSAARIPFYLPRRPLRSSPPIPVREGSTGAAWILESSTSEQMLRSTYTGEVLKAQGRPRRRFGGVMSQEITAVVVLKLRNLDNRKAGDLDPACDAANFAVSETPRFRRPRLLGRNPVTADRQQKGRGVNWTKWTHRKSTN